MVDWSLCWLFPAWRLANGYAAVVAVASSSAPFGPRVPLLSWPGISSTCSGCGVIETLLPKFGTPSTTCLVATACFLVTGTSPSASLTVQTDSRLKLRCALSSGILVLSSAKQLLELPGGDLDLSKTPTSSTSVI